VRGGGHSIAGKAVANDGLMIDLSGMKGIRVDPSVARRVPSPVWCWASSIARRRPSAWLRPWA
jgi:hypothetical protein